MKRWFGLMGLLVVSLSVYAYLINQRVAALRTETDRQQLRYEALLSEKLEIEKSLIKAKRRLVAMKLSLDDLSERLAKAERKQARSQALSGVLGETKTPREINKKDSLVLNHLHDDNAVTLPILLAPDKVLHRFPEIARVDTIAIFSSPDQLYFSKNTIIERPVAAMRLPLR